MTEYGFIGLGHQGAPMAERMTQAGLRPWLWARRSTVLDPFRGRDVRIAESAADLGERCDVIGLCLYDSEATDAVLFGAQGLMNAVRPGTIVAIHSTVGPEYVTDLATRLADDGVLVVDAPVSGGGGVALEGQLVVMVGGDTQACLKCQPMFDSYAGKVVALGGVGAAQATKLINNVLMTAITGLVFDAFEFGRIFGVDVGPLGEVLSSGSAANPSVGNYLALGAETFSIYAWPTLHKDIDLFRLSAESSSLADGLLLSSAKSTIETMAGYRQSSEVP
jgi:3-hydroxyisobutyrate dehydrogenase-like beta-hydroxyacid dehydrogenase